MMQSTQSTHATRDTALCGAAFAAWPVLDAHTRIAEFGGDAEGYDEVAEMVLFEGDAMRRSLRAAPGADHAAVVAVLHEVANNCAMVGAQRCALLARAVEIQLRQPTRLDVLSAIQAIETELTLMLQELSCRQATGSATAHRVVTP